MKKWILPLLLITSPAMASFRPVASATLGLDFVNFHQTQNIVLLAPYSNTYYSKNSDNEAVGGLFLGIESPIYPNLSGQLGMGYYQTNNLNPHGTVFQFTDPSLNNLFYNFKINSYRLLLEGKLLTTVNTTLHPYFSAGVGSATNKSFSYQESPASSADVPMQYVFANHTDHSFTYTLGIGLDYDVTKNIRIGGGYRFSDIGNASLGTIPVQESSTTIHYTHLKLNEFLLQATYLG